MQFIFSPRGAGRCAFVLLLIAFMGTFPCSRAQGQNLFQNASFETGDLSNWVLSVDPAYGGVGVVTDGVSLPMTPAPGTPATVSNVHTGDYAAVANASGKFSISQTVNVTPGATYLFGGWGSWGLSGTGSITGSMPITLGDGSNVVSSALPYVNGTTPSDFAQFRRLFTARPNQTTATLEVRFSSTRERVSFDDLYFMPWTQPILPVANNAPVLSSGDAIPNGFTVGSLRSNVISNNGSAYVIGGMSLVGSDGMTRSTVAVPSSVPTGGGAAIGQLVKASVNDSGEVALITSTSTSGIYRIDGNGLSPVVKINDPAPDGNGKFSSLSDVRMTSSGAVIFAAWTVLPNFSSSIGYFVRRPGEGIVTIARDGDASPAGGTFRGTAPILFPNSVSRNGNLAFNGFPDTNIYSWNGTALSVAVTPGEILPVGGGINSQLYTPAINDAGQIAFLGTITAYSGIYLKSGSALNRLVKTGDVVPSGGTFNALANPNINNAGQLAFYGSMADGSTGVFRTDAGGQVQTLARTGQATPDGGGSFQNFGTFAYGGGAGTTYPPATPSINAGGQVAFASVAPGTLDEAGLYLADSQEVIPVARWGQIVSGSAITRFSWQDMPSLALNDYGQVSYIASLADGRTTSQLFTPTLRWRGGGSGGWADGANWTVGLVPGKVHPIVIAPVNQVTVQAPAGQVHIKSLHLGAAGGAIATLNLNDTVLSALEGVTIDVTGRLTGFGKVAGNLTNAGTVAPGNSAGALVVTGDYVQTGSLLLEIVDASHFDTLLVESDASLSGDIHIAMLADAALAPGTVVELISANSIDHANVQVQLPAVPGIAYRWIDGVDRDALQVTFVPEPSASVVALFMSAIFGLVIRRPRSSGMGRRGGVLERREKKVTLFA
jgi:hypothetical protein